jgi:acyl-CoA reductase-like NAD-dependent aldehyde dehydrogenase
MFRSPRLWGHLVRDVGEFIRATPAMRVSVLHRNGASVLTSSMCMILNGNIISASSRPRFNPLPNIVYCYRPVSMMTTDADTIIANLTATTQTQKCRNTFFRQAVLKSLHDILSQNVSQIKDAIRKDTAVSNLEAEAEVVVTLSIIKEHYAALEPERDLEEEYRVVKGRNASGRQEEWGVVLLEPQLVHTPLFSVMSPLSAALTAGNCVALKVWLDDVEHRRPFC